MFVMKYYKIRAVIVMLQSGTQNSRSDLLTNLLIYYLYLGTYFFTLHQRHCHLWADCRSGALTLLKVLSIYFSTCSISDPIMKRIRNSILKPECYVLLNFPVMSYTGILLFPMLLKPSKLILASKLTLLYEIN